MRTNQAQQQVAAEVEESVVDASGQERRRALRRKLPFGRGAVLLVGDRAHIVGLADLSVSGAFLRTRGAPVAVGETHVVRLLLLPDRTELELRAEVVRVAQTADEAPDRPRGVAVRFADLDEATTQKLQAFIARGLPKDQTASS